MSCLSCVEELQLFTINDGQDKEISVKPGAPEGTYTIEVTLVDDNVDS